MQAAPPSDDNFIHEARRFVQWFTAWPGTRLSPKICLADLRDDEEGRGVGKIVR